MNTLSTIRAMTEKINIISDMAFDGIDKDKSGQIDKDELGNVLV